MGLRPLVAYLQNIGFLRLISEASGSLDLHAIMSILKSLFSHLFVRFATATTTQNASKRLSKTSKTLFKRQKRDL